MTRTLITRTQSNQNQNNGAQTRKNFVSTLKQHGVIESQDFSYCTNAIYHGVLGHSAREHLAKLKLKASANLRNHLTEVEKKAIEFAEQLATETIIKNSPKSALACLEICKTVSADVGKLLRQKDVRQSRQRS